jgi:hypothetical protein
LLAKITLGIKYKHFKWIFIDTLGGCVISESSLYISVTSHD